MQKSEAMQPPLILLILNLLMSSNSLAVGENCLSLLPGTSMNQGNAFIKSLPFSMNRAPDSELYSAAFDLNEDGNPEYFYYLEDRWFCGNQTGCTINIYEYKNGRFRELFEGGIYSSNQFNPRAVESTKYICIVANQRFGWHDIVLQRKRVFRYNGDKYIYTKGDE